MDGILTDPEPCPYVPGSCQRLFLALDRIDTAGYRRFLDNGFRRAGTIFYRPLCEACHACHPLRVSVPGFRPRRDQRRCRRRNRDLVVVLATRGMDAERAALYCRYQEKVHAEPETDPTDLGDLVEDGGIGGGELHLRDRRGRLVGVSIFDRFADALSSVYAYYDPDLPRRSLGTRLVLAQLDLARIWGLR